MAQIGLPTIDLEGVKVLIHFHYCESGLSLLDVIRYLDTNRNIKVMARTLTRRLQVWGFTKYTSRIPGTLLETLQARIIQLFYHHNLTDKEIQRVLQGEGYGDISLSRLQMLRLSINISRCLVGGNFFKNNEEIKEVLKSELNVSSILHYGRRRIYEYLRHQGYLIVRSDSVIHSIF